MCYIANRSRVFQRAHSERNASDLHRRRGQNDGGQEGRNLRDARRKRQRYLRRRCALHEDRSKVETQKLAGRTFFGCRNRNSSIV